MKDTINCYIKNFVTGSTIEFELIPEEITDNYSATFDQQDIRGRSNPIQGYNSSGPRTISYTIQLHDDYCKTGILDTVNKLRALTYPEYGGVIIPPKCYVRFGNMIGTKAITTSVGVTWKKPYRDGIFINADVTLEFTEVLENPKSASQIEGGA